MLRIAFNVDGWLAFWLTCWSVALYTASTFIQGISDVGADLAGTIARESFWSGVFFRAGVTMGVFAVILPLYRLWLPADKKATNDANGE